MCFRQFTEFTREIMIRVGAQRNIYIRHNECLNTLHSSKTRYAQLAFMCATTEMGHIFSKSNGDVRLVPGLYNDYIIMYMHASAKSALEKDS